jgi:D-glycero-alpha-D-manno-heptose 1-phosphate guanylyltransferase
MIRTHRHFKRRITFAAVEVSNMSRYGQLLLQDDTVIGFNTKPIAGPGLINAGIYVVDKSIFDGTPCNTSFSFEKDFLAANVFVLRPHVYKTSAYFIDIGVAEDYARAQRELAFQ